MGFEIDLKLILCSKESIPKNVGFRFDLKKKIPFYDSLVKKSKNEWIFK